MVNSLPKVYSRKQLQNLTVLIFETLYLSRCTCNKKQELGKNIMKNTSIQKYAIFEVWYSPVAFFQIYIVGLMEHL